MNQIIIQTIFLVILSASSFAQLKDVKAYYKNVDKTGNDSSISFIQESMGVVDDFQSLQQIILIRHGEPNIKRKGWVNRNEAQQFYLDYDSVGVKPLSKIPLTLYEKDVKQILTSNLNRAKHTARLCFGDTLEFIEDTLFREFERKVLCLPNIKLPLGFWKSSSRMVWLMGLNNKDIESFKEARQRTRNASEKLIQQAAQDKKVVLVAHGFLNRYLTKYLKKQGWKEVRNGGKDYLSATVLVK